MGRTASHNWRKLFLEYNQGRYKNVAEFAKKKGINPNQMRDEFRKVKNQAEEPSETTENNREKQQKTTEKKPPKKGTTDNPHAWEKLKKQFLDWPEERLDAYVTQLTARRDELEAIPFKDLTPEESKELGEVRRDRRLILSDPDPDKICKVVRRGKKCGNPVERGKEVCWNHGGAPGSGTKPGQQHALKHGFYAKIFPDDEEIRSIIEEIDAKSPLDILWDQIVIQYTAIARAQKIMFVKDKDDLTEYLKREKETSGLHSDGREKEYEIQFAWDKHASFLKAQSTAMKTLDGLIQRYEAMVENGLTTEEQSLRIEKLKQDMVIARERLEIDKGKSNPGKGEAANNERILRLAQLLNNPEPNRNIEDFEEDD